jgi:medium-chain acyl-[acyl-carrier-protein] hydrolase
MAAIDQPYIQTFELRLHELDSRGKLSFPYLCRMLQESAGRHAADLNISSDLLREQGMTWVLSRFHVKRVDSVSNKGRWPGWKRVISVQTWRAAVERLYAIRDFRVFNADGEKLAVATTRWLVLDMQSRRVVGIPAFVTNSHPLSSERALESPYAKLPLVDRVDFRSTIRVTLQSIDQNAHVNNVAYLEWIMDSFPSEISTVLELQEYEILFRTECVLGDELVCETQKVSENNFLHRIYKSGERDKDVIQARTMWA